MEPRNRKMEQILEEGRLVTTAQGTSMLPWIRPGRDVLVLEKFQENVQKYDAVLYKRKNGTYILHRILQVRENDFVLCGDNQYQKEYGIQETQILGVLKGFFRDETYIDCEKCFRYRLFVRVWCQSLSVRKGLMRCIGLSKRVWRKLIWRKN